MKIHGFTLIELLVTVIIVAILASVAIPTYVNTVERVRGREARATLQAIIAAERTYSSERRTTITLDNAGTDAEWIAVGMENPSNLDWTYTFTNPQATAVRARGPRATLDIILDMNGTETDNFTP
ncbi:MAG: prepilin-type N-terminal cleavage/methylation domain-containing protein [Candidatus Omnitrophota bacterium]